MILPDDQIRVRVGGRVFVGWTGGRIGAGIERAARDFSITMTRPRDLAPRPGFVGKVVAGDRVEVLIGTELVMTGHVDALPVSYDDQQVSFSMSGRSLTADLVDCAATHAGGQWRGRTLGQIAVDLAKPYGVVVVDRGVSGAALLEHQVDPGETVLESINRMLPLRQLLAFDDPQGRLVLDRVGSERAHTALVLGENIKSGDSARDFTECFSEYRVSGQRSGNDDDFAAGPNRQQGVVTDARVRRRRVLMIKQSGQATVASCREQARFERDRRAARPFETTYTVVGWRQGDGSLWRPNLRVRVWDDWMGFAGAEMVVSEVGYIFGEQGKLTELRVGPAAAYMPEPAENTSRRRQPTGTEFSA